MTELGLVYNMSYNHFMKLIKENLGKFIFITFVLLLPIISFAEITIVPCETSGKICNPLGTDTTLPELIQKILEGVLKIGIPLVVLAIIYCGFLFVSAQGKPEELGKAKDALLYTIIGAGILLGSWAIAEMISATIKSLG